MNSGDADWLSKFSSGFSTTSAGDGGSILAIIFVVLFLAALAWFYFDWYTKNRAKVVQKPVSPGGAIRPRTAFPQLMAKRRRINPLQQQIIYDIIDEFRKQETLAQAIPAAVLEKYSEFFFQNTKRLRTGAGAAREFVKRNYPVREGYVVEMDFHTPASHYIIRSKVIEASGKTMSVAFANTPAFLKKGMPLLLNYSVGKHFLQGHSTVVDIRPNHALVLTKPTRVELTSERRYARAAVRSAAAGLVDTTTGGRFFVKVLDLSLEGVRIQVEKPLEKNRVYQLTFEAEAVSKRWHFGPLECVPSKTFATGGAGYECGLVFLYLDMDTKTDLQSFMRHTAQQVPEGKLS